MSSRRLSFVLFFIALSSFSVGTTYGIEHRYEDLKLLASDGSSSANFGESIAVSGDVAVIGAPWDDENNGAGAAYVYRYNGATWEEEQKLVSSDGADRDEFGCSVAVSGDVVVVGAWNDEIAPYDSCGSAYVFRYNGSTWEEEQKLISSPLQEFNWFGTSVAVSGDIAVIGAPGNGEMGVVAGAAYVFRYDGGTWDQEQKLTASDGCEYYYLGQSVSISGDAIAVGGPGPWTWTENAGSAYIFRYNGASWDQEQELTPSDGQNGDNYGISVSISEDVALIGARGDDDLGTRSGSAYVWCYNGASWDQEQKLTASDGETSDYFGISVSISGDMAVIGAEGDDDNGGTSGSASTFSYNGITWAEDYKLLASDGAEDDCQ